METILSCKLYRASSRKNEILAAIQNPINQGLVQQLERYLGEEFRSPPKPKGVAPAATSGASEGTPDDGAGGEPAGGSFGGGGSFEGGSFGGGGSSFDVVDDFGDPSGAGTDNAAGAEGVVLDEGAAPNADANPDDPVPEEPPIEEGVAPQGTPITASKNVEGVFDPSPDLAPMKGLLNAREDTTGVNRILVKGDELWIYYEDSVNLNNVMGTAIEVLNAAPYPWLEFNRLARSDNAIVFVLIPATTQQVQPIKTDGEKA